MSPFTPSDLGKNCPICPLCGNTGILLHTNLQDNEFQAPGRWNLRRCQTTRCGILWIDPRPKEEDLPFIYRSYLTHTAPKEVAARTRLNPRRILRNLLGLWPAHKQRSAFFLTHLKPGRVFEAGCGNGSNLTTLAKLGWEISGQDIDSNAVTLARSLTGANIYDGKLENMPIPAELYDVVLAVHVVEHLLDLKPFLMACFRLLKPEGRLVLISPNANSHGFAKFGKNWAGLHTPFHTQIFTPLALKSLVEQTGFSSIKIDTTSTHAAPNYRKSLLHSEISSGFHLAAASSFLCGLIANQFDSETGDEIILIASKPKSAFNP